MFDKDLEQKIYYPKILRMGTETEALARTLFTAVRVPNHPEFLCTNYMFPLHGKVFDKRKQNEEVIQALSELLNRVEYPEGVLVTNALLHLYRDDLGKLHCDFSGEVKYVEFTQDNPNYDRVKNGEYTDMLNDIVYTEMKKMHVPILAKRNIKK